MADPTGRPILLVDDLPEEIELTVRAFRTEGVRNKIVVARDGIEALDLLLPPEGHEPLLLPSIVLMNIGMPRMSGLEALRRLRANPSTQMLPVIMLSNSMEESDVLESQALGANGFVRKPVQYADFLKVAHELGVDWLDLGH